MTGSGKGEDSRADTPFPTHNPLVPEASMVKTETRNEPGRDPCACMLRIIAARFFFRFSLTAKTLCQTRMPVILNTLSFRRSPIFRQAWTKIAPFLLASLMLASPLAISVAQAQTLVLGTRDRISAIYAYPNNCGNVCFLDKDLTETILHYLQQTLRREGLVNTKVTVYTENGLYFAHLDGPVSPAFLQKYQTFMQLGDQALSIARNLHKKGKWQHDWRFFLPIGMPLVHNTALLLMHFPPLSTLTRDQDYLLSESISRWHWLLQENRGSPFNAKPYPDTAVLDLVPIAAPASSGYKFRDTGLYSGSFDQYLIGMIDLWTGHAQTRSSKPLLALGSDARRWIRRTFSIPFNILDIQHIPLPDGRKVPAIGIHHPAFFHHIARSKKKGDTYQKRYSAVFKIMQQDLTAACWQVEMGIHPEPNPHHVMDTCTKRWENRDRDICLLISQHSSFPVPSRCRAPTPTQKFAPSNVDLENAEDEMHLIPRQNEQSPDDPAP